MCLHRSLYAAELLRVVFCLAAPRARKSIYYVHPVRSVGVAHVSVLVPAELVAQVLVRKQFFEQALNKPRAGDESLVCVLH